MLKAFAAQKLPPEDIEEFYKNLVNNNKNINYCTKAGIEKIMLPLIKTDNYDHFQALAKVEKIKKYLFPDTFIQESLELVAFLLKEADNLKAQRILDYLIKYFYIAEFKLSDYEAICKLLIPLSHLDKINKILEKATRCYIYRIIQSHKVDLDRDYPLNYSLPAMLKKASNKNMSQSSIEVMGSLIRESEVMRSIIIESFKVIQEEWNTYSKFMEEVMQLVKPEDYRTSEARFKAIQEYPIPAELEMAAKSDLARTIAPVIAKPAPQAPVNTNDALKEGGEIDQPGETPSSASSTATTENAANPKTNSSKGGPEPESGNKKSRRWF